MRIDVQSIVNAAVEACFTRRNAMNVAVRTLADAAFPAAFLFAYAALFALAYIAQIGIAVYAKNLIWLLPLLTAPIAVKAVKNCYEHHNNIKQLLASNAATVLIYQLFGASFIVCAILDGLVF